MQRLFLFASKVFPTNIAYAHCDIPCGIYDPHQAQLAAHSVIRMTTLINDLKKEADTPGAKKKFIHQLARYTKVKEEHAELVKHEVRILWGDYFKEEHLKQYPEIHDLVFKTMKLASKARQEVNLEAANELLDTVQKIAEIFWKTKNIKSARISAPYPSGGTLLVPKS